MKPVVVVAFGLLCTSVLGAQRVQRSLNFEQRVNAQAAIARVYYAHQDGAVRPFDEAVPRAVLESKVRNALEQSAALSLYWKTAVTDETLERELMRMTSSSRMPARLDELFQALDNDPFLIEECLVRPILVERLTHNFQAMDSSMHVKERTVAEDLHRQLEAGLIDPAAEYPNRTVRELVADAEAEAPTQQRRIHEPVSREQFLQRRSELPSSVGQVSDVVEKRDRYEIDVVLSETATSVRVATYTVNKTTWDTWWSGARTAVAGAAVHAVASGGGAQLLSKLKRAALRGAGCGVQGWHNGQLEGPELTYPDARVYHTAVWTGSEMLIFGGLLNSFLDVYPGLRYDPATDTWVSMSVVNAPRPRASATAVWSGTSMIVWGGSLQGNTGVVFTGGRYDPNTDTWSPVSTYRAPSARSNHSAVWTGSEMIVWGGAGTPGSGSVQSGGRYDPVSDTWKPTSTVNAPPPMGSPKAVWTGSRMLVTTGGYVKGYDPRTDSWSEATYGPSTLDGASAVWTGHYLVIWGGYQLVRCGGGYCPEEVNEGARYNPVTGRWSPTSQTNAPAPRAYHYAVWTGTEMLIWGGSGPTGGRYNPDTDTWTPMTTEGAPQAAIGMTAVWAGHQMIVYGATHLGYGVSSGRYDPATDSWTPLSNGLVSYGESIAWTGSQMIVWGGTGSEPRRYDPATDSWSAMARNGEPAARTGHTAVWTGSSMLIWGGLSGASTPVNSGGRYDPATDAWSEISTVNAPAARDLHSALWTGSVMFVWGGTAGRHF